MPAYLADNFKARLLQRGGEYVRPKLDARTKRFCAQAFLVKVAEGETDPRSIPQLTKKARRSPRKTSRSSR